MGPTDYRQQRLRDLMGAHILYRVLFLKISFAAGRTRRREKHLGRPSLNNICSHVTGLEVKMHLSVTRVLVMCQPHTMTHGESEHQDMITLMITLMTTPMTTPMFLQVGDRLEKYDSGICSH